MEGILFLDKETENGYLHSFVEKYTELFSKLFIIKTSIEGCCAPAIKENGAVTIIEIPSPVSIDHLADLKEPVSAKLGERIVDVIKLTGLISTDKSYVILFQNYRLFYLPEILKKNFHCKIISFIDTFSCEENACI